MIVQGRVCVWRRVRDMLRRSARVNARGQFRQIFLGNITSRSYVVLITAKLHRDSRLIAIKIKFRYYVLIYQPNRSRCNFINEFLFYDYINKIKTFSIENAKMNAMMNCAFYSQIYDHIKIAIQFYVTSRSLN